MKNLKITIFALLAVFFCVCSCSDDVNEQVSYTLTISSRRRYGNHGKVNLYSGRRSDRDRYGR